MPVLLIGNPENRRVQLFCQAAVRLGLPCPEVVSYQSLLRGELRLEDKLLPGTLLRIESPGENAEVEKALIALGASEERDGRAEQISQQGAFQLPPDPGRIRFLGQWYQGFDTLLKGWQRVLQSAGPVAVMNQPEAIRLMFDKIQCQQRLAAAGITVPRMLPGVTSYAHLREIARSRVFTSVFIKPAHGSSASGVIACRWQGHREQAITSIEYTEETGQMKLYNSLKVRTYTSPQRIAAMVDYILREGALVEEWIPKATFGPYTFDVRVVVIGGKACHVLPRLSKSPLTNLHLGNRRGDGAVLLAALGPEKYGELLGIAEKAVQAIPGAFYAGVDVLLPAGMGKPRVLEVNAFGDLLPNLLFQGQDTYTTELAAFLHAHPGFTR